MFMLFSIYHYCSRSRSRRKILAPSPVRKVRLRHSNITFYIIGTIFKQEKNKEDVTKKIENSKKNQLKINLRIPMKEKLIIFGYTGN